MKPYSTPTVYNVGSAVSTIQGPICGDQDGVPGSGNDPCGVLQSNLEEE